ncbi:MAG: putative universal stress protein [Mucilaginibacter sp.]|nr:putative universal stress protein [Mucilaginibacter sp.]
MTIKKILIGVDDSKFAEHAAAYGFEIARKFNASVGLVNIVEPTMMPPMGASADPVLGMPMQGVGVEEMELLDIRKSQAEDIFDRTTKRFARDIKVSHFTEYGSTAEGIINCSKEFKADLIVIGTHSRSGIDRLLMGSVAEHIVRHSEVPVLVVPFKES